PGPGHGPDHGAPLVVVLPVPLPPGGVQVSGGQQLRHGAEEQEAACKAKKTRHSGGSGKKRPRRPEGGPRQQRPRRGGREIPACVPLHDSASSHLPLEPFVKPQERQSVKQIDADEHPAHPVGNAEPFKALENQAGDHHQSDGPKSGDAAGPVPDGLVPLVALGLLPLPVVRVPGEPFQLEQRPGAGAEQHRPGHTQQGGRAAGETGRTRRI
ncbi:Tetracyclin repressor-like C-terminal domain-containing protein, partial [Dysosmobacter welbionis]